jgi:hypothetical protein
MRCSFRSALDVGLQRRDKKKPGRRRPSRVLANAWRGQRPSECERRTKGWRKTMRLSRRSMREGRVRQHADRSSARAFPPKGAAHKAASLQTQVTPSGARSKRMAASAAFA